MTGKQKLTELLEIIGQKADIDGMLIERSDEYCEMWEIVGNMPDFSIPETEMPRKCSCDLCRKHWEEVRDMQQCQD